MLTIADEDEADNLWDATSRALEEIGLVVDQAKSMLHSTEVDGLESRKALSQGERCCSGDRSE